MAIERIKRTILKHEKEKPYTKLYNETINHITDCAALGIYVYLASKPEDWEISIKNIMNHFRKGRDFVKAKLKYLRNLGALVTEDIRDEKGKFLERVTHLKKTLPSTVLKIQPLDNPASGESAPTNKGNKINKEFNTNGESCDSQAANSKLDIRELIDIYHDVLPGNPRHNRKAISTELEKTLRSLIKRWHEVDPKSEPLTYEKFRRYLSGLKELAPNFTLGEYETKSGRIRKNNLVTFARWNTVVKFTEESYS